MIYIIYPCPVSFCPLDSFFPLDSFCPRIILPPWILFYDLHYIPMSHIIFPQDSFPPSPHIILPPNIILPPGNHLMIYTFYPC